jgi:hypothetical protein
MPRSHPTHFAGGVRWCQSGMAHLVPRSSRISSAEQRLRISGSADHHSRDGSRIHSGSPPEPVGPRLWRSSLEHVVPVDGPPLRAVDGGPNAARPNVLALVGRFRDGLNMVYLIQARIDLRSGPGDSGDAPLVSAVSAVDEKGGRTASPRGSCGRLQRLIPASLQRSPGPAAFEPWPLHMDHPSSTGGPGTGFTRSPDAAIARPPVHAVRPATPMCQVVAGEIRCSTANDAGEGNQDLILREVIRQTLRDGRATPGKVCAAPGATPDSAQVETQPLDEYRVHTPSNRTAGDPGNGSSIRLIGRVSDRLRLYTSPARLHDSSQCVSGSHHWLGATRMAIRRPGLPTARRYHDLQNCTCFRHRRFLGPARTRR